MRKGNCASGQEKEIYSEKVEINWEMTQVSDILPHGEKELRILSIKLLWLNTKPSYLWPTAQRDTLVYSKLSPTQSFSQSSFHNFISQAIDQGVHHGNHIHIKDRR